MHSQPIGQLSQYIVLGCSQKMQPRVFSGQLGYPQYGYKVAAIYLPVIRTLMIIFPQIQDKL